jgi:hypothetical protein
MLTIQILRTEAAAFASNESSYPEPSLFGITDGKTVVRYHTPPLIRRYSIVARSTRKDSFA